jgi:carbon starvation protein
MNTIFLAAVSLLLLYLGYRYYSSVLARQLGIDESEETPAVKQHDGVDFVPAKHWLILFGHHFASIAGAAPIIGPVIACLYWGWLPALAWIVFGSIFMGAVHDLASLAISAKNEGRSIADLTEHILDRNAKIVFSLFVFLTLILIVAVFAAIAGQTLANTPEVVLPTLGLIPVAILIGWLMYHRGFSILLSSLLGVAMLFGFLGLLISRPELYAPPVVAVSSDQGWMFPHVLHHHRLRCGIRLPQPCGKQNHRRARQIPARLHCHHPHCSGTLHSGAEHPRGAEESYSLRDRKEELRVFRSALPVCWCSPQYGMLPQALPEAAS